MEGVTDQAIQITMFYEYTTVEPMTDTPSDFSNILIKDVKGTTAGTGIQIRGLPEHKLNHIRLERIDLTASDAVLCSDVEEMEWQDVKIKSLSTVSNDKKSEWQPDRTDS